MTKGIHQQFEELEKLKSQLLSDWRKLSHEQVNFRPGPDKWSLLEVASHIISSEDLCTQYMRKKTLDPSKLLPTNLGSQFRSLALEFSLWTPLRFKAPTRGITPELSDKKFENIEAEWIRVRQEVKSFFDQLDSKLESKLIFRHPVAGRLNATQTFNFWIAHIKHHIQQVNRIKAHPEFTK